MASPAGIACRGRYIHAQIPRTLQSQRPHEAKMRASAVRTLVLMSIQAGPHRRERFPGSSNPAGTSSAGYETAATTTMSSERSAPMVTISKSAYGDVQLKMFDGNCRNIGRAESVTRAASR